MRKSFFAVTSAVLLCLGGVFPAAGYRGRPEPVFAEEEAAFQRDGKNDFYRQRKDRTIQFLRESLVDLKSALYVYRDFSDVQNHFTQKSKIYGGRGNCVRNMDENWKQNPYKGESCIRCQLPLRSGSWGGWLFLNGYIPEGQKVPRPNQGTLPHQGLDLRGVRELRFAARGKNGGERVEFFTAGFGYDGKSGVKLVKYPGSSQKQTLGTVALTKEWQEYRIPLEKEDMTEVVCGFGYVGDGNLIKGKETEFYLDEIRFIGESQRAREGRHLLRSYQTKNLYVQNAAFSYDNALAAMAFISEGMKEEAEEILDAFVYAVENDRYRPGRLRNAYAAGNIVPFPAWGDKARLPGFYDLKDRSWYEDRYQVGSNTGNTSYAALALLGYDAAYKNESYVRTAKTLMDWVLENCQDGRAGFTAGIDGWPESGAGQAYPLSYKSTEHNIDAFAAFRRLYERTSEEKYRRAADSALQFIRSMYDEEKKLFYLGTKADGLMIDKSVLPLDTMVWSALALGRDFAPYRSCIETVKSMKTEEGGYPFSQRNENGGFWSEGTAYTALMFRELGETEEMRSALDALLRIQNEDGSFPAATVDNHSTGIRMSDGSLWEYSKDEHLAPAAWFVMSVNGFNPYRLGSYGY